MFLGPSSGTRDNCGHTTKTTDGVVPRLGEIANVVLRQSHNMASAWAASPPTALCVAAEDSHEALIIYSGDSRPGQQTQEQSCFWYCGLIHIKAVSARCSEFSFSSNANGVVMQEGFEKVLRWHAWQTQPTSSGQQSFSSESGISGGAADPGMTRFGFSWAPWSTTGTPLGPKLSTPPFGAAGVAA